MERAKVVVEVGPTSALPIGQTQTQTSHGKMDNMTAGMVAATTNELELDTLHLHKMKRTMKMLKWSSWKMRTSPLRCWLWLSATTMRHQQKGWMNLPVQHNSSLWVTWLLAPTRARAKAEESLLGKARTTKVKANMS